MQRGLGLRLDRPGLPTSNRVWRHEPTQAYGIPGVALLHTRDTRQTRPVLSASTPPAHDLAMVLSDTGCGCRWAGPDPPLRPGSRLG